MFSIRKRYWPEMTVGSLIHGLKDGKIPDEELNALKIIQSRADEASLGRPRPKPAVRLTQETADGFRHVVALDVAGGSQDPGGWDPREPTTACENGWMQHCNMLPQLRALFLCRSSITAEGLEMLSGRLEDLEYVWLPAGSGRAEIAALKRLPGLKYLDLYSSDVRPAAFEDWDLENSLCVVRFTKTCDGDPRTDPSLQRLISFQKLRIILDATRGGDAGLIWSRDGGFQTEHEP